MKKLKVLTILMMSLLTLTTNGQMQIDEFYDNKSEYLIYSIVENFDSTSQDELIIRVKNWGGTNFVNMKQVLVSETKEQLVFNFITKSFFITTLGTDNTYDWYIRMVVQVKDNKIKISLFDDGNCYFGGVSARTYKFLDYFKNGVSRKPHNNGFINVRKSCVSTANSLVTSIKNVSVNGSNNDW